MDNNQGIDSEQPTTSGAISVVGGPWAIWSYKCYRKKTYPDSIKELATIYSTEQLWTQYKNYMLTGRLPISTLYALFRKGIQPAWEDSANENGGRLILEIKKCHEEYCRNLYWHIKYLLMQECLKHCEQINGVTFVTRTLKFKLSVWVKDYNNSEAVKLLTNDLAAHLNLKPENFFFTPNKHPL